MSATVLQAQAALTSYTIEGAYFNPGSTDHRQSGIFLNITGGSITFDTTNGTYDFGGGAIDPTDNGADGVFYDSETSIQYAVFSFENIFISDTTTVTIIGNNGFSLVSENNSIINAAILFDGIGAGADAGDISLVAGNTLTINADVSANGATGAGTFFAGGDGGDAGDISIGGKSVIVDSDVEISSNGGNGGFGFSAGSGGNGATVDIVSNTTDNLNGSVSASGGTAGFGFGGSTGANGSAPTDNGIGGSISPDQIGMAPAYLPEPSSVLFIATGTLFLLGQRRRPTRQVA